MASACTSERKDRMKFSALLLWYHLLSMHAACTERKQQPIDKPFAIPHEGNMSLQCHCMLLLFSTCVYIYYIYIMPATRIQLTRPENMMTKTAQPGCGLIPRNECID